jgi:hypothetical protein
MLCPSLKAHHVALKRVFVYLSNTIDQGITHSAGDVMGTNVLYSFSDASFVGIQTQGTARRGWLLMMNNGPLSSVKSKDQNTVALSSCDSEICAAVQAFKDIKYLRYKLGRIGLLQVDPTKLHVDNQLTTAIITKGSMREETKHFGYRKAYLRDIFNVTSSCLLTAAPRTS